MGRESYRRETPFNTAELSAKRESSRSMPVGIEDFKELVENDYYFIDKTRFIYEILREKKKVSLITRPRRFGKTLTLSMLMYFFTLENAEKNRALFSSLEIFEKYPDYAKRQGESPVLLLSLKDTGASEYSAMIQKIRRLMQMLYIDHAYLLNTARMDHEYKKYFKEIKECRSGEVDLGLSLKMLTKFLSEYYQKKVIILIDEYDAPIQMAWQHNYETECLDFMRDFLGSALKTNAELDFSILTGVLRISKESIFSGLNNFKVYSIFSDMYSDIFGFTSDEIEKMACDLHIEQKIPEIQKWYDGYSFGCTEIYNPLSVLEYIDEGCKPNIFWIHTSENAIIRDCILHMDEENNRKLESLILAESIVCKVDENTTYRQLYASETTIWMLLVSTGYLKSVRNWLEDDEYLCELKIPNLEIQKIYKTEICNFIEKDVAVTNPLLQSILYAMKEGDVRAMQESLSQIFCVIVSYFDVKKRREDIYHIFILGLFVSFDATYDIRSNRESGYGRYDIALFPKKTGDPGILLEIKQANEADEMETLANEAVVQIRSERYSTEFTERNIQSINLYAIVFYKKHVLVRKAE